MGTRSQAPLTIFNNSLYAITDKMWLPGYYSTDHQRSKLFLYPQWKDTAKKAVYTFQRLKILQLFRWGNTAPERVTGLPWVRRMSWGGSKDPACPWAQPPPSQHALLRVIYTASFKRMCITIVMIIMFCSRKRFQNLSHHTRSCLETAGQSTRKCRADYTPHEPRGAANHKQHCPWVRLDEALLQGKPGLREACEMWWQWWALPEAQAACRLTGGGAQEGTSSLG